VRNFILLTIILFLYLIMSLQDGIKIDNIKFQKVNINSISIKLNSKLTLKIEEINIPTSNDPVELSNIDIIFDRVKSIFNFFEFIEVNKIVFKDNIYKISFVNDALYIINNKFEIFLKLKRDNSIIKADISLLYIKKEDINIWGVVEYNLDNDDIYVNGSFRAYDIEGKFKANKIDKKISLNIYNANSTSISKLVKRFGLKSKIEDWIIKKTQAKFYNLVDFNISGDIKNDKFKVDLASINGKLLAQDAFVNFRKGVKPVKTELLTILYRDNGLEFRLKNPTYMDKSIKYGKVTIEGIGIKKPYLTVFLDVVSRFDNKIQQILKAYNIKIPIIQLKGLTKANLKIGVNLKSKKVEVEGDFNISKGRVAIKKLKLDIKKGHISYVNREVKLKNIILKNGLYKGVLNGKINLKKSLAILELNRLTFYHKKFKISNIKVPFNIYYKNFLVDIPLLETQIYKKRNKMVFDFKNLLKVKRYIKDLKNIDGGKVKISTKDFNRFTINGEIKRDDCFMYERIGICNTIIPINGEFYKSNLTLNLFNNKIIYKSSDDSLKVDNIHINLNKLILTTKSNSKNRFKKFSIIGKHSQIKYNNYKLLTDKYNIAIDEDNLIFRGFNRDKTIYLEKSGNKIFIDAMDIDDRVLHPLINFNSLKGGKYSLYVDGTIGSQINGEIEIIGGILSKFKAYNNLVAFINTIPALITLSKPGFNDNGYKIKEGIVKYSIDGEILRFKSIKIVGESSTIVGAGVINLKTKKIKIDLAVQVAREIGNIISKIPLVGYILVGDNKSMAIGLSISGDLNNPRIDTHTIKNMVELPFAILERLLKTPSNLLQSR